MKKFALFLLLNLSQVYFSQVNITTGSYVQNFGTANITSWTNNSTFTGWYIGSGTHRGYANISAAVNSFNAGGYYTYNCGGDSKIGSRASGSATLLYYGVVLQNNTGQTIRSIKVKYSGYQMSLAENGATNTINFEYITGASAPSITAASATNVPALAFTQLQNDGSSGSNQLNWYPCTQFQATIQACIPVTLANGSYILLRWKDTDDTGNDHHMAIDNLDVAFDLTGASCLTLLSVELLNFDAFYNGKNVDLKWTTATEINNDYFTVERSRDGINFEAIFTMKGKGNSTNQINYNGVDENPKNGISYYRLKQTDFDGTFSYSEIKSIEISDNKFNVYPNPTQTGLLTISSETDSYYNIKIFDVLGKIIFETPSTNLVSQIDLTAYNKGIYFIQITSDNTSYIKKILYH